ncbi:MAG: hypothetical protein EOP86_05240 [Verrucomicrobiaceae bacterium]|nr:MAG: hypothetical protein EOP86_05240 [Verrucomicrobiaceae bacterium]
MIGQTAVTGSQILATPDHEVDGLWRGILYSAFLLPFWALAVLWALAVRIVWTWQNWGRFQKYWIPAPAVCLCLWVVWQISLFPPTADGVFHRLLAVRLPQDVSDLGWEAGGGGSKPDFGLFVFTASPSEMERLIRELRLLPVEELEWATPAEESGWLIADFVRGEKTAYWKREPEDTESVRFFLSKARNRVFIAVVTRGALAADRGK